MSEASRLELQRKAKTLKFHKNKKPIMSTMHLEGEKQPVLGNLRQEDTEFQTRLSNMTWLCLK